MMSCFFRECRVKSRSKSHTTLFSVPKDNDLFEKWRQVVPQTERRLTISDKLCEVHFEKHCMSFFYETKLSDGSLHRIVRGHPLLKQGSIPSIFPDEPDVFLEEKEESEDTANNKSTVDGIGRKNLVEKQSALKSPASKPSLAGHKTPISKKMSPMEKSRSGRQRKIPLKYVTDFVTEDDASLLKACRFQAGPPSSQGPKDTKPAKVKKIISELEKRNINTPTGRKTIGATKTIQRLTGESDKKKPMSTTSPQVDKTKTIHVASLKDPDKDASIGSGKIKKIIIPSNGNEAKTINLLASIGDSVTIKRLPSSSVKRTASGEEVAKSGRVLKTIGDDDSVKRNPKKRKTSRTSFVVGESKSKQTAVLDSGASPESEVARVKSATYSRGHSEISSKKLKPVSLAFEVGPEIVTKYNLKIPIVKIVPLKSIDLPGYASSSEQFTRLSQNLPTESENKNETTAILNQSAKRKAKEKNSMVQESSVRVDEDIIPPLKKSKLETSFEMSSETVENETAAPIELLLLEEAPKEVFVEEALVSVVESEKNTPILSVQNEKDNESPQNINENESSKNPLYPALLEDSISSLEQDSGSALDSEKNSKLNLDIRINVKEPNTDTEIRPSKESIKTGAEPCKSSSENILEKSREDPERNQSLVRVRDIASLCESNKQPAAKEKQLEDGPSTSENDLRHPVDDEPRESRHHRECVVSNVTEEVTITKITNNKSEEQCARRETANDEKTTVGNSPSPVSNSARLIVETKTEEKKIITSFSQKDTRRASGRRHKCDVDHSSRVPDGQQHSPEDIENVITTPDFSILLNRNTSSQDTKLKPESSKSIQLSLPEISIRVIPLEYYVTQPHLYKNQLITESVKKVIEDFLSEQKILKNRNQLSNVDRDEVVSEQLHGLESGSVDVSQEKNSIPKIDSSVTITPISTKHSSDFLPKSPGRVTPISAADKGSGLVIRKNDSSVTVGSISISKLSDFITKPSGRVTRVEAPVKECGSADICLKEVSVSKTDSPEIISKNLQSMSSDFIAKPSDEVMSVKAPDKGSESTAVFLEKDSVPRTDSSLTVTPVLITASTDSITIPSSRVTPTKAAADKGPETDETFQEKTDSPKPVPTNLESKSTDSITTPSDNASPVEAAGLGSESTSTPKTDSSLTVTPVLVNTSNPSGRVTPTKAVVDKGSESTSAPKTDSSLTVTPVLVNTTDYITNPSGRVTPTKAVVDGSETADVFQKKNPMSKIDSSETISKSSDCIAKASGRITPVKGTDTEPGSADVSQEKDSLAKTLEFPVVKSPVLKNKSSDSTTKTLDTITPVKDSVKAPASVDVFLDNNPIPESDSSETISPILKKQSSDFLPKSPGRVTPISAADKAPASVDLFLGDNPIPESDSSVTISPILKNESSDFIAKASDRVTPVKAAESGSAKISPEKESFPKTDSPVINSPVLKNKSSDSIKKTLEKITPVKDDKAPASADIIVDNNHIPRSDSSVTISPILKNDSSDFIAKATDRLTPVKAAESGSANISPEKESFPKTDSPMINSPELKNKSSDSIKKKLEKITPVKDDKAPASADIIVDNNHIPRSDSSVTISPILKNDSSDFIAKATDRLTPVKAAESGSANISPEKESFPKTDSPMINSPELKNKSSDSIKKTLEKITPVKDDKAPASADVFVDNHHIPKSDSSVTISPILKNESSDFTAKTSDRVTPVKPVESGSAEASDFVLKTDSPMIIPPTFGIKSSKSAEKPTKAVEESGPADVFHDKDSAPKTESLEIDSVSKTDSVEIDSVPKTDSVEIDSVSKTDSVEIDSVPKTDSVEIDPVLKTDSVGIDSVSKTDSVEIDSVPKTDSVEIDSVPKTDSVEIDPVLKTDSVEIDSVSKTDSSEIISPVEDPPGTSSNAADMRSGSPILSEKKNSIPIIDSVRTSPPSLKNESSDSILKSSGKLASVKPAGEKSESDVVSQKKNSIQKTVSPILKNESTGSTKKPSGKVVPIKITDTGNEVANHSKMYSPPMTDSVEIVPPPFKKKLLDSWTKTSHNKTPVKAFDKGSRSAVVSQKEDPIPKTDSLKTNKPQLKNELSNSVTKTSGDATKQTVAASCSSHTSVDGVFTRTRFHEKKRGLTFGQKTPGKTLASSRSTSNQVTEKEFEHVLLQIREMSEGTPSKSQSVEEEALPRRKRSRTSVKEVGSGKLIKDGFPLKVRQEVMNLRDKRKNMSLSRQKPKVSSPSCGTSQDLLRVLSGEPIGDETGAKTHIRRRREESDEARETSPFSVSSDIDQGDGEWIRVEVLAPSEVVACSPEKGIDGPRSVEPHEPSFSSETDGCTSVLASESMSGLLHTADSAPKLHIQVSTSAESSDNSPPSSPLQVKKRSFYDTLALRKIIKKARLMSKGAVSAISRGTRSRAIRKRKNLSNEGRQVRVVPIIPLRKQKNLDGKSSRVKMAAGKIAKRFEGSSSESQPIQQDGVSSTSETHEQSCEDAIRNEFEEVGRSGHSNVSCRADDITSESQIKSVEMFSRGISKVETSFNVSTLINPTNKPEDKDDVERISQFVRCCFRKLKSDMGENNASFAKVSVNISLVDSDGLKSSSNKKHDSIADQAVSVSPNRAGKEETISNERQTSGGQLPSQLEGYEEPGASLMEEASCIIQKTHSTEDYEAIGSVRYIEQNILEVVVEEQFSPVSDAIEESLTESVVYISTIRVQDEKAARAADSGEFLSNREESSVTGNFSSKELPVITEVPRSLNEENGQNDNIYEQKTGFNEVETAGEIQTLVDVDGKNEQEAPFCTLGINEIQSNESKGWKNVAEETSSTRLETCEETHTGEGIGTCIEKVGIARQMRTFVVINDKSTLEEPICAAGVEEMQPNSSENLKNIADTISARSEIRDVTKNIEQVEIGIEVKNCQEMPVCAESPNTMAERIHSTRIETCEETAAEEDSITEIEEVGTAGEMETSEDIEDKNVQEPPYCTIRAEEAQFKESVNRKNVEEETGLTLIETYEETHSRGGDVPKNIEEIEIAGKTVADIENRNVLEPPVCSIVIKELQSNQSENWKNIAEETTSKGIAKCEEAQAVAFGSIENIEDVGTAREIQTLADFEDKNAGNAPFRAIEIEEMQSSESGDVKDTAENRCSIRTEKCEEASSGGGGLPKKDEEIGIAENCIQTVVDIENKNAQESVVRTAGVEEALSCETWKNMMEETSSSRIETCEETHLGNMKIPEEESGCSNKVLQDTIRTCSKDKENEIGWATVAAEQTQTGDGEREDGKEIASFGSAEVGRGEPKRETESSPVVSQIEKQGISCGAGLVHVCAENETAVSKDIGKEEIEPDQIIQEGVQIKFDERTEEEKRTEIHFEKPSELQDGSPGSPAKETRFEGMGVENSNRIPDKAQTKFYHVIDEENRSETHCQKPFELQGDSMQRSSEEEARFDGMGVRKSNKIEDEVQIKFDIRSNVEEITETHSERQVELQRSDGQGLPEEEPHTSGVGFKKGTNVETTYRVRVQKDTLRINEVKHKCLLPEFYDDANSSQESTGTRTRVTFEPQRTENLENTQIKALETGDNLKANTEMRLTYDMPILDDVDEINITSAIDYALCTLDEEQEVERETKGGLASGKKIEMECSKSDTGKKSHEVSVMKSGNTQNLIDDVSKGTGYGCYNRCSQLLGANMNKKEPLLTDSSRSSYPGLIMSAGISDHQSSSNIFEACFDGEFPKDKPPESNFYPVSVVKEAIGIDIIPSVSFVLPSLLSNADLQEAQSKCLHLDSTGIIFSTSQAVLSSLPELSEDSSSFKSTVMPSLQDPHEVLDPSHHDCTFLSTNGKTLGCPYEEIGHESLSQSFDMLNEFAVEQQFDNAGLVEEVVTNQDNARTEGISIVSHPYSSQETFSSSQIPDQSLVSASSNKHPPDENSGNMLPFLM